MAFDAFIKLTGIDGESTDSKHAKWIEISSFSWGVSQPAVGSRSAGAAAGSQRANFQDLSIVKRLDRASPKLALHCANGKKIPEVTLELCRATGDKQKYMEYKLSDVIVSSLQPSGASGGMGEVPEEEVSFNYGKIEWKYTATDPKTGKAAGDVSAQWSLVENKGA